MFQATNSVSIREFFFLIMFLSSLSESMGQVTQDIEFKRPASFEFETFSNSSRAKNASRSPVAFSSGRLDFESVNSFRILAKYANLSPQGSPGGEKKLSVRLIEIVASNGELIEIRREVGSIQGGLPATTAEFDSRFSEKLSSSELTILFFDAKTSWDQSKRYLSSLVVFGDFTEIFRLPEIRLIDSGKLSNLKRNDEGITGDRNSSEKQIGYEFSKFKGGFVLTRIRSALISNLPLSVNVPRSDDDLFAPNKKAEVYRSKLEKRISKLTETSFYFESEGEVQLTDGQYTSEYLEGKAVNVQWDTPHAIVIGQTIPNGTAVNLVSNGHIKAEWQDGQVVRVFDAGFVDDLSKAEFIVKKSSWPSWYLGLAALSTVAAIAFVVRSYSRRANG